jgi:hypothetical protein
MVREWWGGEVVDGSLGCGGTGKSGGSTAVLMIGSGLYVKGMILIMLEDAVDGVDMSRALCS